MEHALHRWHAVRTLLHRAGPYVLLELLLPGGTLAALLLYWVRRQPRGGPVPGGAAARIARALDVDALTAPPTHDGLQPLGLDPAR